MGEVSNKFWTCFKDTMRVISFRIIRNNLKHIERGRALTSIWSSLSLSLSYVYIMYMYIWKKVVAILGTYVPAEHSTTM
jgi:hypothetical protein